MAFEGYLIKLGNYTFPMKHIAEETYKATPKQRQELDAYRDNLGKLHREVVDNMPSVIEFTTVSGLTNTEVKNIFELIHSNYVNEAERKLMVTYYLPETDSYSEPEEMYMPNIQFPIDYIDGDSVVYNTIALTFIGY